MLNLQLSKNTPYQNLHEAQEKKTLITYFQLAELITLPKMHMLRKKKKPASFLTV